MRLYKRGKYWWVAWPGDERESTKCTTAQAAQAWCRERERERADPHYAASKAKSIHDLITAFIADRRAHSKSDATVTFYKQKTGHLARIFGKDAPLSDITALTVDQYIAQRRRENVTAHTVAKEIGAIKTALRKAKRWGWWRGDLDELFPQVDPGYQPRQRWLTVEEVDLLVEELSEVQPHYAGAVAFAVATGARRSEIARATREDIETGLESGQVQIRGSKTLKSRQPVPVLSIFRGLLERSLRLARPDGVAFGVWVLSGNARREILTACRRAEIAPATWNDLRRTHGRWLRRAGVSVELIGEQLRHTSPAMARRVYATIAPDELGAQIEAVLCPPAVRSHRETPGHEGT